MRTRPGEQTPAVAEQRRGAPIGKADPSAFPCCVPVGGPEQVERVPEEDKPGQPTRKAAHDAQVAPALPASFTKQIARYDKKEGDGEPPRQIDQFPCGNLSE